MSLWGMISEQVASARDFAEATVDALAADEDDDSEEEKKMEEKVENNNKGGFLSDAFNQVADLIIPEDEEDQEEEEEKQQQEIPLKGKGDDEAELFRIQARQLAEELRKSMEKNKELEARIESLKREDSGEDNLSVDLNERLSKMEEFSEQKELISSKMISELKIRNEHLQTQAASQLRRLESELEEEQTIRNTELQRHQIELNKEFERNKKEISELQFRNDDLQKQAASQLQKLEMELEERTTELQHQNKNLQKQLLLKKGPAKETTSNHISELHSRNEDLETRLRLLQNELEETEERSREEIEAERRESLDVHHREQAKMNIRMKELLKKYHHLESEHEIDSNEIVLSMKHKFETYESSEQTRHEESLRRLKEEFNNKSNNDETQELTSHLNATREEFSMYKTKMENNIQDLQHKNVRIYEQIDKVRDEYEGLQRLRAQDIDKIKLQYENDSEQEKRELYDANEKNMFDLRKSLESAFLKRLEMSRQDKLKLENSLESDFQRRLKHSQQLTIRLRDENKTIQTELVQSTEDFERRTKETHDQAEAKTALLRRELILAKADLKMIVQFLKKENVSAGNKIKEEGKDTTNNTEEVEVSEKKVED